MFCSNCGEKAEGKFCYLCGSPLRAAGKTSNPLASEPLVPAVYDWENDVHVAHVLEVAAVRAAIASHAATAQKPISAEAFLDAADKLISGPVSYAGLAAVAQPMWASLGVRTGQETRARLPVPIGRAIAKTFCSLARHGQQIEHVEQLPDGCRITAELPSSVFAMKGSLQVSLHREGAATQVTAGTNIPGQVFDWGKSRRCLQQLMVDLASEMGLPRNSQQARAA